MRLHSLQQNILRKNEDLYQQLLHQEGKVFGGNKYIFNKLKTNFEKDIDIQN